jgi:hypothetical protein
MSDNTETENPAFFRGELCAFFGCQVVTPREGAKNDLGAPLLAVNTSAAPDIGE